MPITDANAAQLAARAGWNEATRADAAAVAASSVPEMKTDGLSAVV